VFPESRFTETNAVRQQVQGLHRTSQCTPPVTKVNMDMGKMHVLVHPLASGAFRVVYIEFENKVEYNVIDHLLTLSNYC